MLFVAKEKNYRGTHNIFYKKFHNEVRLVVLNLLVCFLQLDREKAITIFNPEQQDLVEAAIQKEERTLYKDKIDLYEITITEFNQIEDTEKLSIRKRVKIYM